MNIFRRTEWYSVRLWRGKRTEYHSVLRQLFMLYPLEESCHDEN